MPDSESPAQTPSSGGAVSRWRWSLHLLLLALYPLLLGALGYFLRNEQSGAMLPRDVAGLFLLSAQELGFFGLLLGAAWTASRANPQQLLLQWRGILRPFLLGLFDSIILRLAVSVVLIGAVVIGTAFGGSQAGLTERMRPEVEQIVDAKVLVENPLYFALALTLISFVVAGLREELWRAGVLAGLRALYPSQFDTNGGRLLAVIVTALLFGAGHVTQGIGGVAAATLLGFGLGVIMLRRQSTWQAVLAHGFFNATSFVGLYLFAKYQPGILRSH